MSSQTDNTNVELKVLIRKWILERISDPVVLDLFCGSVGLMYQNVWKDAVHYLGVDKNEPHNHALTIKASAEQAAAKFDLDPFNIFDVDPYDVPWIVARRILKRIKPGRYGMALTSGEHRGLSNGYSNNVIRATLGLSGFSDLRLLVRYQPLILKLMVKSLGEIEGIQLLEGIQATTNRGIAYIGIILNKSSN